MMKNILQKHFICMIKGILLLSSETTCVKGDDIPAAPPLSIDGSEGAPDPSDLLSTGIGALTSDLRIFDDVVGRDRDLGSQMRPAQPFDQDFGQDLHLDFGQDRDFSQDLNLDFGQDRDLGSQMRPAQPFGQALNLDLGQAQEARGGRRVNARW